MTAKQLKNSILQQAIQGKLIKQNKEDKPASELLKRIKAEREKLIKSGKIKINKNISAIYRKGNSFYEKIENEEICIDEELPFEIPKTWEWTKLSFVSDMFTGNSINENEKKLKYKGLSEGYFYVATKDVNFNNEIDYYNGVRIPKNSKKFRIAPKNSILFCVEGGSAGKKIAITDKDICFGNKLCCFVSYGIDIKYLYYYIQSPMFIYDFKRNTTGIIGGVSINTLKQMFLPLPPIEEQKRIVNKLNQLMPLIEEYEEKENKLNELDKKFPERLKKSILKEAFDGKLIKSSNKKTLEEICIYSTSNIAIKDIKNKKGNYPVYGASGIIGYVDFYSKEKECVAVVKDGSIGKVFLLPAKSSVISTLCYLENIEILNIKYLYYFLQSINFIKYKKGSMIPHIYFKDYKKEKVIIPPIEEQKRIVEKLDKLINACEELKKILFI